MKNNTTNYTINATQKVIIITKKFEKAANCIGSKEYNELVRLMNDFPTFEIPFPLNGGNSLADFGFVSFPVTV